MTNCTHCNAVKTRKSTKKRFDKIGKTYYILSSDMSVLCFRHWHQANRPEYIVAAEYDMLQQSLKEKLNPK